MDTDRQDTSFQSWAGSEGTMGSQCSDESLPNASPAKKPGHCAEADGRDTKDTKGTEEKDSETEMSKEVCMMRPTN